MLVAGVNVGDVTLHHVFHQLLESDFRDPAELFFRLRAVALGAREQFDIEKETRRTQKVGGLYS